MKETRFRIAIVGCGDIGNSAAIVTRLNPRIKAVTACDSNGERAAAFARRHRIPGWETDYTLMVKKGGFDAVYLAVPHHLHFNMIKTAVVEGYPVLVEKPVTRTLQEGREAVNLAAEYGVKLGVNYQRRYSSGCYRLARAVQNNDLGRVNLVRINIPWLREIDYFDKAPWHASLEAAGGGTLITQGSHYLDIAMWALRDDPPVSALGATAQRRFTRMSGPSADSIEVEDLASGIVELESGAQIQICSSMIASSEQAVSIEVYGDKGTANFRDRPWPGVRFRDTHVKYRKTPVRAAHPMLASFEGFRQWIVNDKPFLIPAVETLPALAAVEAIYASAQSGRREDIKREFNPPGPSHPGKDS